MSSTTDKVKGIANKVAGSVKEGVGKAMGNQEMEAEGTLQKARGELQETKGKVKDAVKSVIDKA
ncbi:CsbD family protein [Labrys sp. ZIDIC5]|uniref:CsbD family protein n=1 Tax=Labrys sedimenti TaxID=3106036 RepID=UPI002ACA6347|nr:CsbD family protein [Labrys sp. ZIDIC5]MDZ5449507.1 CsbD family protein [Labrys sp. ZIDIC5]